MNTEKEHNFELTEPYGRNDIEYDYQSVPFDLQSGGGIAQNSTSTSAGTNTTDCNFSSDGEGSGSGHNDLAYERSPINECHSATSYTRPRWNGRADFILTLIGYTIGLGNVWKFPSLCQQNGGASFLIPYFIMLIAEGIPLYYMELCIGQRLRKGSSGVWHAISPYLDGVGVASAIVCFLVCLYYNVILAWCMIYFVNSFKNPLPWSQCPKELVRKGNQTFEKVVEECSKSSPTLYFWYRSTLDISSSIDDGGKVNWTVSLSLFSVWALCWLCMVRGIKSTGKVVYVTAILPLIILAVMFFRGVHLKGFQEGLTLLFIPEFERLKEPSVWLSAATQTFYSLGVAYGSLICFASYNSLKNDTTRDAILMCVIDAGVSIYASVVIFCFIGYRAQLKVDECLLKQKGAVQLLLNESNYRYGTSFTYENYEYEEMDRTWITRNMSQLLNMTISNCSKNMFLRPANPPAKTGLAFITFTEAINSMPNAPLWSILFFLMLITLGIDTQFGMLEGVITPILDAKWFPKLRIEVLTGIICLLLYLLGFTMVQNSGNYWLQLIDDYCSGIPLLVIALVECLSLSYIYGMPRFCDDIEYMTNKRPRTIWMWCWKVISPVTIVIVLLFSIVSLSSQTPVYDVWDAKQGIVIKKPYPPWAVFIGVVLTLFSVAFIPLIAFLRYFRLLPIDNRSMPMLCTSKRTYKRQRGGLKVYFANTTTNSSRSRSHRGRNGHFV